MAGITPSGFIIRTFEELLASVGADIKNAVGAAPVGALLAIVAAVCERIAELWEVLELLYAAMDVDSNTGVAQDATAAITGAQRLGAAPSTVTLSLTGTPATLVVAGSRAKHATSLAAFATLADATILSVPAWASTTAYALGARRTNATRIYVVTTAGTSAGSGGPSTTASAIVDGTVTWRYVGDGTGVVDAASAAALDGPTEALSGTITNRDTPVIGWSGVINLLDADLGRLIESSADFRVRREQELAQSGTGTPAAIRAALQEVAGVQSVTVFHNDTDFTDADGMTPHSVEALVRGGTDAAIAETLRTNVSDGIATLGTTSVFVVDEEGFEQEYRFSRPTEILIYVGVTVVVDATVFPPTGGDTLIESAIVDYGDVQAAGKNVVAQRVEAAVNPGVPGVLESTCLISKTPTTTPVARTTIAISRRELAVFDSSRITVSTSEDVP